VEAWGGGALALTNSSTHPTEKENNQHPCRLRNLNRIDKKNHLCQSLREQRAFRGGVVGRVNVEKKKTSVPESGPGQHALLMELIRMGGGYGE